jgi:hypothetical protein
MRSTGGAADRAALTALLSRCGRAGPMIPIRSGVHVWIATAHTDMCRGLLQIHQLCRDILGLFLSGPRCDWGEE